MLMGKARGRMWQEVGAADTHYLILKLHHFYVQNQILISNIKGTVIVDAQ